MSIPLTRRGLAVLAAAGALLLAGLAAAQADAGTLYACVKKNGNARIFTKKPRCKKRETKLSWSTEGPSGKNGLNGLNGLNGTNGKEGPMGKEGPAGPLLETLPSGRTEWGVYALEGSESVMQVGFSFPLPLTSGPKTHFVADKSTPPAQCPGSVSNPRATPGNLCVYEGTAHSTGSFEGIFNPENESFAGTTSRFGFGFDINNVKTGENAWTQGTWAVTAP